MKQARRTPSTQRRDERRVGRSRVLAPAWGLSTAILALMCALSAPAMAQPKKGAKEKAPPAAASAPTADAQEKADAKAAKNAKPKTLDFTGIQLGGQLRSPQLLYFLERANEELERASLEKRSFIPHMVRSMDEEAL
jgi:hypothetical protein